VLLGVSGGIAAYKAPELVRRLRDRGFEVRCAVTRAASSFVSPLALEVVSGHRVHREEWLDPNGSGEELHITTAAWADALCVAPATAHLLGRLALGLADDFLTGTALAFGGPLVLAPAMHAVMWSQPSVQLRCGELRARGATLIGPVEGALASGEIGMGRMAEIPDIVRAVEGVLAPGELLGRTVLVTAGPTQEPIDPVRYLGNRSSGKMGFALAAESARRGARTLLVAGPVSLATPPGVERFDVGTAQEMEAAVRRLAPEADVVVMAAAVADFRPARKSPSKIKKGDGIPSVDLVANPDILSRLPEWAPGALRVGFAAETGDLELEARRKLESKGAHLLVANDVSRGDIGFGSDHNEVVVFGRESGPTRIGRRSKQELARDLFDLFLQALESPRSEPEPISG